jgi:hypothetical protein
LDLAVASLIVVAVKDNRTKSRLATSIFLLMIVLTLPALFFGFLYKKFD